MAKISVVLNNTTGEYGTGWHPDWRGSIDEEDKSCFDAHEMPEHSLGQHLALDGLEDYVPEGLSAEQLMHESITDSFRASVGCGSEPG